MGAHSDLKEQSNSQPRRGTSKLAFPLYGEPRKIYCLNCLSLALYLCTSFQETAVKTIIDCRAGRINTDSLRALILSISSQRLFRTQIFIRSDQERFTRANSDSEKTKRPPVPSIDLHLPIRKRGPHAASPPILLSCLSGLLIRISIVIRDSFSRVEVARHSHPAIGGRWTPLETSRELLMFLGLLIRA
jgi:hypothetical protein